MKKKNEQTSKRIATIAAKILRRLEMWDDAKYVYLACGEPSNVWAVIATPKELKALAASALTQVKDKKK